MSAVALENLADVITQTERQGEKDEERDASLSELQTMDSNFYTLLLSPQNEQSHLPCKEDISTDTCSVGFWCEREAGGSF